MENLSENKGSGLYSNNGKILEIFGSVFGKS